MLKVVGASWTKARISIFILIAVTVFGVLMIVLAITMDFPESNGNYCTTVFWSPKYGFRVEFWGQRSDLDIADVPKGVARACFKDSIPDDGWAKLEIETQSNYPDRIQAFAAGMLEGALTWRNIHHQWTNTIEYECEKDIESQHFCLWARGTLSANFDNVCKMAEIRGQHDHYWYQVWLYYQQLAGLKFGFETGVNRAREEIDIPEKDFLLLNAIADLRDLREYFGSFIEPSMQEKIPHAAKMVLKVNRGNDSASILFGHSSDGEYSSMLRILKRYHFRYRFSAKRRSQTVPGSEITFTSYPASLSSADDFYVLNGRFARLVVGGVRMRNENMELWGNVDLRSSPILGARVMTANRLAHNGRSWAEVMKKDRGTGAKQWVVVDTKRLQRVSGVKMASTTTTTTTTTAAPSVKLLEVANQLSEGEGLIWIVDQIPGRLHSEDMTREILERGSWFSDGTAFNEELLNLTKVVPNASPNITTMIDDLLDIAGVLTNQSSRGDLDDTLTTFGNIDFKLYSETNTGDTEFLLYSGPPHSSIKGLENATLASTSVPFFAWPTSGPLDQVQHEGHPDEWNFDLVMPDWAWITARA